MKPPTPLERPVTNDSGIYRVPVLQPGSYEIEAKLAGFKTLVNFGVVLTIGAVRTVDLALSLGAISEIVVVSDQRTLVDTEDSQLFFIGRSPAHSGLASERSQRLFPGHSAAWSGFRPCPLSPVQRDRAPFSLPAVDFEAIISHWMGRPITTKVRAGSLW